MAGRLINWHNSTNFAYADDIVGLTAGRLSNPYKSQEVGISTEIIPPYEVTAGRLINPIVRYNRVARMCSDGSRSSGARCSQ
jgi:hypothetical protein